MKYDFIIAGAGCAGLSLLYSLLQEPTLQKKSILVIDKDNKKKNDRTWCFWEKKPGLFESIIHAKWNTLEFLSSDFEEKLDLGTYTYKMIQGIDFYNFVIDFAKKFSNVTFLQESIISINSNETSANVKTIDNSYSSNLVFNSTAIFNPEITEENSLLQHFKGWVIKTEEPIFNPEVGRLMDFRIAQEHGATFMYVLPTSTTEALVEFTLFTPSLLEKESYNSALKKYIKEELNIDNYTITHEEFGVIPMSLAKFKKNPKKNIINIGTSGGYTKASSGYTFQFIQKDVAQIIENLKLDNNLNANLSFKDKLYNWYDRTLIDVLLSKKLTGKDVFTKIFKKNSPEKIFAFLGNESSLLEDIAIMKSLPLKPFLVSGIKQLQNKN
ncbi:lycopene cyclase family protein [Polaribacter sp. PL03]|uniref:lycopene cyclase family protein n=1 Tax=Polaribacter sp. PL03 TaxID=3088353 RepID=UPI0029D34624|nr:lycopene cyclase family protein [Polaribacter sp. PL03]MDX6745762.1 lycopene cyclase family protein [Polaribacter sp. PL03]